MPQSQHVYSQIIWIIQTSWVFKIELEVLHRQTLPTVCTVMRKKYSQRNFPWLNKPGNNSFFFFFLYMKWSCHSSRTVVKMPLKQLLRAVQRQPVAFPPHKWGKILTIRKNYWRGHLFSPTLMWRGSAALLCSCSLWLIPELSGWSLNNLLHPAWSRINSGSQHVWLTQMNRFGSKVSRIWRWLQPVKGIFDA